MGHSKTLQDYELVMQYFRAEALNDDLSPNQQSEYGIAALKAQTACIRRRLQIMQLDEQWAMPAVAE